MEEEDKEVNEAQLEAEWSKLLESRKSAIPSSEKDKSNTRTTMSATSKEVPVQSSSTLLEWALQRAMKMKSSMDISILLLFSLQKCTVKDTSQKAHFIELIIDKFNKFRKILDTDIVTTFICLSMFLLVL